MKALYCEDVAKSIVNKDGTVTDVSTVFARSLLLQLEQCMRPSTSDGGRSKLWTGTITVEHILPKVC